jgi:predicted dehydrogenase
MRVAIIGTRWGRVHVGAFRRLGHEIAVLIGADPERTRSIAAAEGIPHASIDPEAALDADFVVIASPAPTHAALVRRLRARPLLCEKPLAAGPVDPDLRALVAEPGLRLWINYAFGFLETAARWADALGAGRAGVVERFELTVATALPALSLERALTEVAVHPVIFLGGCTASFSLVSRRREESALVLELEGPAPLTLQVTEARAPGIDYHLRAVGTRGALELRGAYRVGGAWQYAPVTLNGAPISEPERSAGGDVWHAANHRLVEAVLDAHLRGRSDPRLLSPAAVLELEAPLLVAAG